MQTNKQVKSFAYLTFLLSLFTTFTNKAQVEDFQHIIAPEAELTLIDSSFSFTEGPAADSNGNVYFTDQPNNAIYVWNATNDSISLFTKSSGRSNGLYFDKHGHLIACADLDNQLWKYDKEGNHKILIEEYNSNLLNGPNDVWVHPNGKLTYFTDPLYERDYWGRNKSMQQDGQHVYLLHRGKLKRVTTDLNKPNGIVGSKNGKKLFIADIGAWKTYEYDINKKGDLTNKKLFVKQGADGITIDEKGNLYLSGKGVTVFNPAGEKIAYIPVPEPWTANVCFGGPSNKTLFITASKSIYKIKMNVQGAN